MSEGYSEFMDRLDHTKWRSGLANFNKDRIVFHQEYKDYPVSAADSSESGCYRLQKACCQFALGMHLVRPLSVYLSHGVSLYKGLSFLPLIV